MNVYAEYHLEGDHEFRKITLLQFGESWDLIGSAVLKNPGSAKPEGMVSYEEFNQIKSFLSPYQIHQKDWQRFRPDTTMRFLEKIFSGAYLGSEKKLDGVIQLFNLTYLKEPKLDIAHLKANEIDSQFLFPKVDELVLQFKNKPVYLGWFDTWKKVQGAEPIAKGIFEVLKNKSGNYLSPIFEENRFYHPIYINRSLKKPLVYYSLQEFQKLIG
ncbi:hypothetical protein [Algoriphagus formosus]|uniref:hypothetical protein n=1 Tax=Algoriphagus formosus TaxID=2007308 RepID=UPI000C28E1C5|nr:hypothetical protein [Algoriphagus formosus]